MPILNPQVVQNQSKRRKNMRRRFNKSNLHTARVKRQAINDLFATVKTLAFEDALKMFEDELKTKDFVGCIKSDETKNDKSNEVANIFLQQAEVKYQQLLKCSNMRTAMSLVCNGLRCANWAYATYAPVGEEQKPLEQKPLEQKPPEQKPPEQKPHEQEFHSKLYKVRAHLYHLMPRKRQEFRRDATRWLVDYSQIDGKKKEIARMGGELYKSFNQEMQNLSKPPQQQQKKKKTSAQNDSAESDNSSEQSENSAQEQPINVQDSKSSQQPPDASGSSKQSTQSATPKQKAKKARLFNKLNEVILVQAFAEFSRREKLKATQEPRAPDQASNETDKLRDNIFQKYLKMWSKWNAAQKEPWKLYTADERKKFKEDSQKKKEEALKLKSQPRPLMSNAKTEIELTIKDEFIVKSRRELKANQLIFYEQPIVFKYFSKNGTAAFCGLCFRAISNSFVPCTGCRRAVFCSDVCAKVARDTNHKDQQCSKYIWHKQLTDASALIYQLVGYCGGWSQFAKLLPTDILEKQWLTQANKPWPQMAVLMAVGKTIPWLPDKDNFKVEKDEKDKKAELGLLVETYHLAEILKQAYPESEELLKSNLFPLYQLMNAIKYHPFGSKPLSRVRTGRKKQLKRTALGHGLGAFGGVLTFACKCNVYRRLNLAKGKIEYVARDDIQPNEPLTIEWGLGGKPLQLGTATDLAKDLSGRRAAIQKRFPRFRPPDQDNFGCGCQYCKDEHGTAKEGEIPVDPESKIQVVNP